MRSLRAFDVEPWLRSAGQQVWTRIRRGLGTREEELHAALQQEVEQLREVRTNVERATQLARVLDAVFALAEAHDLTEAQLSGLREVPVPARVAPVMELARKLERSAALVWEQMLGETPSAAPARRGASDTQGSAPQPRPLAKVRGSSERRGQPAAAPRESARVSVTPPTPGLAMRVTGLASELLPQPAAAFATRVTVMAAELRLPQPAAAFATRVTDLVAELRLPLPALPPSMATPRVTEVRVERAGVDAARASLSWSASELSLRLRVTQQAALDAVSFLSEHTRAEIALWLLSKGAQLVIRKWVVPQLARGELRPQLLMRVALASGATASIPLRRAASRVQRVRRAVSPRRLLGR